MDQHRGGGGLRSDHEKIQEVVDGYPGLYRDVLTYLKERIKEVLTGASATIVVSASPDLLRYRASRNIASAFGFDGRLSQMIKP